MLHLIFVDNFVFAYCYGVLAALLLWGRFRPRTTGARRLRSVSP